MEVYKEVSPGDVCTILMTHRSVYDYISSTCRRTFIMVSVKDTPVWMKMWTWNMGENENMDLDVDIGVLLHFLSGFVCACLHGMITVFPSFSMQA